jgi:hypothetical protein
MFDVTPDGEINTIFVVPFYRKVRQLWETIDKSLFESRDIEGPAARENSLARAIQSLSSTINDKGTPTPAASGTFIQV